MVCYLQRAYLYNTPIEINKDPRHFLPLNYIYLGAKVTVAIAHNTHGLSKQDLEA